MNDAREVAKIAALIGDDARSQMLDALMAGRALTATELVSVAGITKQTGSAHLRKLIDAGLIAMEPQGRHRYFRIASEDVAHLLESLMGIAYRIGPIRNGIGPRDPAMRRARVCYDHLAGEMGVLVYDRLQQARAFENGDAGIRLSPSGRRILDDFGVDMALLDQQRRTACRACLDWSERRHHLAGAVGAAVLQRIFELHWAVRDRKSRVIHLRPGGERALRTVFQ